MRRRLFTFSAAVSLILFLACAGLWGRGLWWFHLVSVRGTARSVGGYTYPHMLRLQMADRPYFRSAFESERLKNARYPSPYRDYFRPRHTVIKSQISGIMLAETYCGFGFACVVEHRSPGDKANDAWVTSLVIPFYFPTALTPILPLLWLRKTLRHRRCVRLGLCLKCGYDLRASQDRCPECGKEFASATAHSSSRINTD